MQQQLWSSGMVIVYAIEAELTNFVPRDIQKIIYKAMGFAQLNNRNYLIATDIKEVINKNFKTNKSIGFIK